MYPTLWGVAKTCLGSRFLQQQEPTQSFSRALRHFVWWRFSDRHLGSLWGELRQDRCLPGSALLEGAASSHGLCSARVCATLRSCTGYLSRLTSRSCFDRLLTPPPPYPVCDTQKATPFQRLRGLCPLRAEPCLHISCLSAAEVGPLHFL